MSFKIYRGSKVSSFMKKNIYIYIFLTMKIIDFLPADELVNAVLQSKRQRLLVKILLTDLVQYLQTTDYYEPIL